MNRTKYIVMLSLVMVALFFTACQSKVEAYIIPKEILINILCDVHIAEGMVRTSNIPSQFKNDTALYSYVYSKYGYTKVKVDSTINYYTRDHADEFERIYERVIEQLSELESQQNKLNVKP